jgi:hypothetical protein
VDRNVAAPWAPLHARAAALDPDRRTAFALACAEHLVATEASRREDELRAIVHDGWDRHDVDVRRAALEERDDLDDDEVAAVALALDAVARGGPRDATLWTSGRALDAAYDRVGEHQVRAELDWQSGALELLERTDDLAAAVVELRSRAG